MLLYGLKEATIDLAERVGRRVHYFKIYLAVDTLEANIQQNQAFLGEKAHGSNVPDLNSLVSDPECMEICKKIEDDQKKLHFLEDQLVDDNPITCFEQDLRQANSLVASTVVSNRFFGIGKKLKELSLPSQIRVVFVTRNSQVKIADEDTLVQAHDRITYVCHIEKANFYRKYWIDS